MLSLTKYPQRLLMMGRGESKLHPPTSTSRPLLSCNANSRIASNYSGSIIGEGTNKNPIKNDHRPDEVCLKGAGLRPDRMPKHVLMMLDGSRRACEKNGMELTYEPFYRSFVMFAELCLKLGIPAASFAVFATCTWKRTSEDCNLILRQFQASIEDNLEKFIREGMKVSIIGQKWRFSKCLQDAIDKVEEATKNGEKLHIIYLVSYGARWDMVEAARTITKKVMAGEIEPEHIDEALVQQHLSTRVVHNNVANPDLLIRCGGKRRLSNFYLWQMTQAELYFSNLLLFDFGEAEFLDALRWFQKCDRRFGK